jgi:hypothetical protein
MELLKEFIEESEKHPVLDVGDRVGDTEYIDYIKVEEMTSPVMRGVDRYNRKFVVLKLLIGDKVVLQTFFQRFTNVEYFLLNWEAGDARPQWRGCGNWSPNTLLCSSHEDVGDPELAFLLKVMKGNIERITDDLHFTPYYLGKYIYLYDEAKRPAAITIQRKWRECRYNPAYRMCTRVQLRAMEEVYGAAGKTLL